MKTLHNQAESSRKALFRNIKNIQASPSNNKITLTMYKKKEKEIVRKHTRYKLLYVLLILLSNTYKLTVNLTVTGLLIFCDVAISHN